MDIHKSEFLIACYKEIPYVVNTINKSTFTLICIMVTYITSIMVNKR